MHRSCAVGLILTPRYAHANDLSRGGHCEISASLAPDPPTNREATGRLGPKHRILHEQQLQLSESDQGRTNVERVFNKRAKQSQGRLEELDGLRFVLGQARL